MSQEEFQSQFEKAAEIMACNPRVEREVRKFTNEKLLQKLMKAMVMIKSITREAERRGL